jgi:hypothetical protein
MEVLSALAAALAAAGCSASERATLKKYLIVPQNVAETPFCPV